MGFGKSSGTQSVQMTPEQQRALTLQTDALEKTFLPAYQNTVTGALDVANKVMPVASSYASKATDVAGRTGLAQEAGGYTALGTGLKGLTNIFGDDYKQQQINAALQPVGENIREQFGAQDAMFGGAGSAGSSRYALASKNLDSLSKARLGNVAAQVSADVENRKAGVGTTLAGMGQSLLGAANTTAAAPITYAQTPQDIYSKYASVVYGTPQASTTPNFTGTQGSSGTSKGFGASAGGMKSMFS
jgi:hypothetical protein